MDASLLLQPCPALTRERFSAQGIHHKTISEWIEASYRQGDKNIPSMVMPMHIDTIEWFNQLEYSGDCWSASLPTKGMCWKLLLWHILSGPWAEHAAMAAWGLSSGVCKALSHETRLWCDTWCSVMTSKVFRLVRTWCTWLNVGWCTLFPIRGHGWGNRVHFYFWLLAMWQTGWWSFKELIDVCWDRWFYFVCDLRLTELPHFPPL